MLLRIMFYSFKISINKQYKIYDSLQLQLSEVLLNDPLAMANSEFYNFDNIDNLLSFDMNSIENLLNADTNNSTTSNSHQFDESMDSLKKKSSGTVA